MNLAIEKPNSLPPQPPTPVFWSTPLMARSLDHTIAMMGVLSRRAKKKRIQELLRWSAGEIKLRREKRLLKCKGQISRNIASIVTRRRQGLGGVLEAMKKEKGVARKSLTTKRRVRGDDLTVAQDRYGMGEKANDVGKCNGVVPTVTHDVAVSALYIIKASPGKGLGMFAAVNIEKGTRILAEKPFFSLVERPELSESDGYALDEISEAFGRLSVGDQDKYMSLHCPERPDCNALVSIYEANCYEMGSGACICLDASRINHSCIPNAHFSWNTNIERETLHAVNDIFKGEEITISYCPAIRTFDERKSNLESYFFTCRCPACRTDERFGIKSQIRRLQMHDLDHKIADFQIDAEAAREEYDERNEEPAILKLVELMDKEGLVYDKSQAYRDAAECALKRGLRERALEYAGKELDVEFCCVGRDAPSYLEAISFSLKIYFGAKEIVD